MGRRTLELRSCVKQIIKQKKKRITFYTEMDEFTHSRRDEFSQPFFFSIFILILNKHSHRYFFHFPHFFCSVYLYSDFIRFSLFTAYPPSSLHLVFYLFLHFAFIFSEEVIRFSLKNRFDPTGTSLGLIVGLSSSLHAECGSVGRVYREFNE